MVQAGRHATIDSTRSRSGYPDSGPYGAGRSRRAAVEAIFSEITRTFGISFVPDLFEGMRNRPAYLATAWELFKAEVNLERMDRGTKLIVALAISTNEAGIYFIVALPHTFRLGALDDATYGKLLSIVRFFNAFDQYLSTITPDLVTAPLTLTHRDPHIDRRYGEAPRVNRFSASREGSREEAAWLGGLIIMIVALSWWGTLYWFIG